jgi:glycosidase
MIQLRQKVPALAKGQYALAVNDNNKVFSFYRILGKKRVLVMANLSDLPQTATFVLKQTGDKTIFGGSKLAQNSIQLKPYEVVVADLK